MAVQEFRGRERLAALGLQAREVQDAITGLHANAVGIGAQHLPRRAVRHRRLRACRPDTQRLALPRGAHHRPGDEGAHLAR
jgi:hypothetical protein